MIGRRMNGMGPRSLDDTPERRRECESLSRAVRKLQRLPVEERERSLGVVLHEALAANA